MEVITRQSLANNAAKRWAEQYRSDRHNQDKKIIGMLLAELGEHPDPDKVDEIIGNSSWTRVPWCRECGSCDSDKEYSAVIMAGDEPGYDALYTYLCIDCMEKGMSMIKHLVKP